MARKFKFSTSNEALAEAEAEIERIRSTNGNAIDFSGFGLEGLPDSLFTLTSLTTLDLSANQLSALPKAIGSQKSLTGQ
ncbi:MAG: hypothetical protein KDN22_13580 [Verrucomicrobiae bacterium]|nr:hypothetical protein [Verrucomicrobiae bacterium]